MRKTSSPTNDLELSARLWFPSSTPRQTKIHRDFSRFYIFHRLRPHASEHISYYCYTPCFSPLSEPVNHYVNYTTACFSIHLNQMYNAILRKQTKKQIKLCSREKVKTEDCLGGCWLYVSGSINSSAHATSQPNSYCNFPQLLYVFSSISVLYHRPVKKFTKFIANMRQKEFKIRLVVGWNGRFDRSSANNCTATKLKAKRGTGAH